MDSAVDILNAFGRSQTWLYIPSFIEIHSGVSETHGVILPFPFLWLFAFTTACTTLQAVMHNKIRRVRPSTVDTLNVSLKTNNHKNEAYVIKMTFKMVSKPEAGNSH